MNTISSKPNDTLCKVAGKGKELVCADLVNNKSERMVTFISKAQKHNNTEERQPLTSGGEDIIKIYQKEAAL